MFHKLIKCVEIDVGEELTGEVADRQTSVLRRAEQALLNGNPFTQVLLSFDDTMISGTMEYDGVGKRAHLFIS
jgi:hypothetical protein